MVIGIILAWVVAYALVFATGRRLADAKDRWYDAHSDLREEKNQGSPTSIIEMFQVAK